MIVPETTTPLMRQYFQIKQQHPHELVLFQVGDFYELFFDDAKNASAFLGIALTKRGNINGEPIPLCGVPVHALDHYLMKLIKGGFKVVICDQLEEPKPGKIVDRGVTQVLTPGTLTDSRLLDEKSASFLFSFFPGQNSWGLVFAELLTAQIFATTIPVQSEKVLEGELIRFFPDEIILPEIKIAKPFESYFKKLGYFITPVMHQEDTQVDSWIKNQFALEAQNQLRTQGAMHDSLSYLYQYLLKTQRSALEQFRSIHFYQSDDFLMLDAATQGNLELIRNNHDGSRKNTLLEVLDGALTPMGSRMIKKWVMRPLINKTAIVQRQDVIQELLQDVVTLQKLEQVLVQFGDLERIIGRIALRRGTLHDYLHVQNALARLPDMLSTLECKKEVALIQGIISYISDFHSLYQLLQASLHDDATTDLIIKAGFDQHLDHTRQLAHQGSQKIIELEALEQKATGISSLKIRHTNVQGYYIEITNTHKNSIPERYIRQQTLVGRERFTCIELQQLQQEIMHARSQVEILEQAVFDRIKNEVHQYITQLRKFAHAIAHLDALLGLARIAYANHYTRCHFNTERAFSVSQSRHPVIERVKDHTFIPNDIQLSDEQSTLIITGPNMGGKSTYLRQVALISIMAQVGSYVPATYASVPILDRIFTRIGAGDNLAQGKSTFLVEMEETAAICMQSTDKSLVILDEVGRGTSTYDGLALAQAVVEYIHNHIKARCLFATHYQELTLLASHTPGIVNYHAANNKTATGILFLYKIIPGIAHGSFGIEVAKIAHLPNAIIKRAEYLLQGLCQEQKAVENIPMQNVDEAYFMLLQEKELMHKQLIDMQQKLLQKELLLHQLQAIDYDHLSPRQAFDMLWKLKETQ